MGKKTKKIINYNPEEQDQFQLNQQQGSLQKQNNNKLKQAKPLKQVFQQILKHQHQQNTDVKALKKIQKNQKRKQKKKIKKLNKKQQEAHSEEQNDIHEMKKKVKIDQAHKYVRNQKLENDLKARTLNGVLKVLNLISQHQQNQNQQ